MYSTLSLITYSHKNAFIIIIIKILGLELPFLVQGGGGGGGEGGGGE